MGHKVVFPKLAKIDYLYWLPRVLAIGVILFLGIFALDVLETGKPLTEIAVGFFMHLLPNFLLLAILVVAWKKEDIGGLLFMLASVYMWLYFNNQFLVNALLFGSIFLIGGLFLADYFIKERGLGR